MDCRICTEAIKVKSDIIELECGHMMCNNCFDRLIKSSCPYCRKPIANKVDGDYNIEYEFDEIIYDFDDNYITEIDNILPMSELYYIEDLFYEDSYDIIHANRTRKNKKNNSRNRKKNFTSNKNRESFERKKKKWKKSRN